MSPPNKKGQTTCETLMYELYRVRGILLGTKGENIVNSVKFNDFTANCVGNPVNTLRAHKEETEYRKKNVGMFGGMAYFTYEPTQPNKFDLAGYKYMNSSGNVVTRDSDRMFTPEVGLVPVHLNSKSSDKNEHVQGDKDNTPNVQNNFNGQRKKRSPKRRNSRRKNVN
jgi:hypothetical protein